MSDTHINAYYADVDEAEQKLARARAELQEAKDRLAVKKQELNPVVPVVEAPKEKEAAPVKEEDRSGLSPFAKKK